MRVLAARALLRAALLRPAGAAFRVPTGKTLWDEAEGRRLSQSFTSFASGSSCEGNGAARVGAEGVGSDEEGAGDGDERGDLTMWGGCRVLALGICAVEYM